jgi:ssDNA thymidine ADP-ribosyltransferase, DarT
VESTLVALVEDFVAALQKIGRRLYHFTDSRNIPSIQQHGLLPKSIINVLGLEVVTGGDAGSLYVDQQKGLDQLVSLSFCRSHPMAHVAKGEGRIESVRIITICPSVLLRDGVLLADQIATAHEAKIGPPNEMIPMMDLVATYQRLDWRTPEGQQRRNAAEKWEALIPGVIPLNLIGF